MLLLIALAVGGLIPIQTAANSRLRLSVGNKPVVSALISFTVALLVAVIATAVLQGNPVPQFADGVSAPWWVWLGGAMGVCFVLGNILLFPRLGAVQTVVLPILGQVIMGLAIDRFGLFGAPVLEVTFMRVLGAVVVLAGIDIGSLGSALLAVAVTLLGAGLLSVPLWLRMMRALNAERAARIRNEEREEIASHLHDSVLQTLALIQRQADDPHEVVRLARSQERELRRWLFEDAAPAQSSLAAALRTIAGEVEDQHGVKVTPVTVGDVSMDIADTGSGLPKEHFTAVLGAAREALVNAAKHADVPVIDLFAETEPHQVSVFVRDRGVGFDVDAVPADRQGLAKSIRGRVERRGGQVEIVSTLGRGTEVRIIMPRTDSGTETGTGAEQDTAAGAEARPEEAAEVVVEQPPTRTSGSAVRAEQR
ncbi:DMT family transporter [Nocardia cyriacigeorgica]|uniref:DMT family transporter n=1 Tax=Nocardia cyriacigeorgica TaxID=135487 RepID=UPI0018930A6E|nr:DMT family transporter [Nocardia cyriacigeorgica]MBF6482174.1 DMT family transporter [Nocardia cyriacigeorgica]